VTLDPVHGWRQNTWDGFLKEWQPAGCLTLVAFAKGAAGEGESESGRAPKD
jgi:hypothetical protein